MLINDLGNWYSTALRLKASNPETGDVSKDPAHTATFHRDIILVSKSEKNSRLEIVLQSLLYGRDIQAVFFSIFKLTIVPWMTTSWSWEKNAVDDFVLLTAPSVYYIYFLSSSVNSLFDILLPHLPIFIRFLYILFFLELSFLLLHNFYVYDKCEINSGHWGRFFYGQRRNILHDFHWSRLLFVCVLKMWPGVYFREQTWIFSRSPDAFSSFMYSCS